jgi:hypothetical protein
MRARARGILSFAGTVLAGTGRSGLLVSPFVVLVIRLTVGQSGLSGAAADGMSFALIEFLAALVSIGLAAHLIAHESPSGRTEYWEFLCGSRVSWWLGKVLGVWICLGLCLLTVWPAFEVAWFFAGRSGSEPVHSLSESLQELRGLAIDGATAGLAPRASRSRTVARALRVRSACLLENPGTGDSTDPPPRSGSEPRPSARVRRSGRLKLRGHLNSSSSFSAGRRSIANPCA